MTRTILFVAAVLVAGCGGGGGNDESTAAPAGDATQTAPAPWPAVEGRFSVVGESVICEGASATRDLTADVGAVSTMGYGQIRCVWSNVTLEGEPMCRVVIDFRRDCDVVWDSFTHAGTVTCSGAPYPWDSHIYPSPDGFNVQRCNTDWMLYEPTAAP